MEDSETVTLRDGSPVVVRSVRPDDAPLFKRGFERLGERSRQRRFMGHKARLSTSDLFFFTHVDHHDHEAVGALDPASGEGLGVARYVRDPGVTETAEAAVAVVDDYQGRGLGSLLLERLVTRARAAGVRRFSAELFADNRSMLALFERVGAVRKRHDDPQTLAVLVELEVSEAPLKDALRAAACGDVELAC